MFIDKNFQIVEYASKFFKSLLGRSLKYSPKTIKQYSSTLEYFLEYLENRFSTNVDITVASIDGMVINEYLKMLDESGMEASTLRNREVAIKEFLTWLTTSESGKVRINNGYGIEKYKGPNPYKKVPKFLLVDEVVNFINLFHDENYRCLIHFLVDSGIRASEVGRLKKKDLPKIEEFPDDTMYFDLEVQGSKGRGGKIKPRITFISRAMLLRINKMHKQHPLYRKYRNKYGEDMPVFLNVKGEVINENALKNLIYKTAKRGGLSTKKYSAHKCRHTFAMSVLMSEFDTEYLNKLIIVKDALGHNSIKTTEMYSLIPPAVIKNLQAKNKQQNIIYRFEEAQFIFDNTYLAMKNHIERRGR